MTVKSAVIFAWLLSAAVASAQNPGPRAASAGVAGETGWPLDVKAIRDAISRSQLFQPFDLAGAQISAPPDFTTRTARPQFDVIAVAGSHKHHLIAILRCRERADCRSFLVEIALAASARDPRENVFRTGLSKTAPAVNPAKASEKFLVDPRHLAMLVIEEDGLRITEPVRPAKRAGLGERVQVTDAATHRSLFAQVAGPGLVRPADTSARAR